MKYLVLCGTLSFLLFINTVYSVTIQGEAEEVSVNPGKSFSVSCTVTYDGEKPSVEWLKNNEPVKDSRINVKWEGNKSVLSINPAKEDDIGNYTCRAVDKQGRESPSEQLIRATREIAVRVPDNKNVIEEETLRLECEVLGNPKLRWVYGNKTYTESEDRVIIGNYTDDGRVIENGVFIIEHVQETDKGIITCIGINPLNGYEDSKDCLLRVRGKYAALWPFFGICAEVIILCAIIVIYEKKRNKTELEESDTDQSPDQKNTPDHGKEVSLRHRQ